MPEMKSSTKKIITGCSLIVIAACIVIVVFVSLASPDFPEASDLKEAARAQIIHNLKDPTSPEFFNNGKFTKETDSIYIYTESLKALNGFGLKVPQDAYVKLKWTGSDPDEIDSYILLDLKFKNR